MRFLTQKSHRRRFFWNCFTFVLIVLISVLLLKNVNYKSKLTVAQQREKILVTEIEGLKNSLKESEKPIKSQSKLYSWEIGRLKKNGLQDPIKDIISDLMKHKELIPYKGVLGGTMGFYHERNMHILTSKWVFASFDDGHIGGNMLLEYQVSDEGKISWRVIDSYLD